MSLLRRSRMDRKQDLDTDEIWSEMTPRMRQCNSDICRIERYK